MSAREIVSALKGRWCGSYGVAKCPAHDDRTPSLTIRDAPGGDVVLHCFSGCDWRVVKDELRRRGLLPERKGQVADVPTTTAAERQARQEAEERERASRTAAALAIWRECQPAPETHVETYLRSRGITIQIPPSIRFHPHLKHGPTGELFPAMVAGIQGPDGRIVAAHRTYLLPGGRGKAQVHSPKMTLGPCRGGAVRLAAAGEKLGLSEGIETGLSIMQPTDLPVWACLSTSGLRGVILPEIVREPIIFADGDVPGREAARQAAERWTREGLCVRIADPGDGLDHNDLLQRGAI